MTTFTGVIHRDKASAFLDVVLPQLLDPRFREDALSAQTARARRLSSVGAEGSGLKEKEE